jgi:hypothetical protein
VGHDLLDPAVGVDLGLRVARVQDEADLVGLVVADERSELLDQPHGHRAPAGLEPLVERVDEAARPPGEALSVDTDDDRKTRQRAALRLAALVRLHSIS